jgi:hypothetical protein
VRADEASATADADLLAVSRGESKGHHCLTHRFARCQCSLCTGGF